MAAEIHSGEGLGSASAESIQISKHEWALGPMKPILRALGVGFAIGLATMTVLALLQ